jgi:hypothetical protein
MLVIQKQHRQLVHKKRSKKIKLFDVDGFVKIASYVRLYKRFILNILCKSYVNDLVNVFINY